MSLEYWFPLTSDLHNQGLASLANASVQSGCSLSSDGKLGGCYKNTGTTANVATPISFSADQFTLCAWVRIDARTNGWHRAVGLSGSGTYMGMVCENTNGTSVGFHYYKTIDGTNTSIFDTYPCSPTVGAWYHYAMCYDGTRYYVYLNGNKITDAVANKPNIRAEMTTLWLFGGTSNNYVKDSINDVRIYSHCLSPLEIAEIAKGMILHYPMTGGGRGQANLYTGTADFSGTWDGASNWTTDTTQTYKGFVVKKRNGAWGGLAQRIPATNGDIFTISFYAKVDSGGNVQSIHRSNLGNVTTGLNILGGNFSNGGTVWIIDDEAGDKWKYCWATVQIVSADITWLQWRIENSNSTTTMYICGFKMERGDKPTPWIPHTSDAQYTTMGYNDTTEYDTSGYLHNGTINGSVSYSSDTPRYSVSTHFTASGSQHIVIPSMTLDMKNITFAAWGKFDTTSNWMRIFDFGEKASGGGYGIIISNGASGSSGRGLTLVIVGSGGTSLLNQVVYTITTGVWFNVAVTILDSSVKVYVNGNLEKTYTVTALNTATPLNLNYIGKSNWSSDPYLEGNVSDFRLYATALSAEDITKLYNTSASLANNGTLMAYEFTEM